MRDTEITIDNIAMLFASLREVLSEAVFNQYVEHFWSRFSHL